jgi:hypothetical protein
MSRHLDCNVISKVELLFLGKIVGSLQVLDGVVKAFAFQ